MGQLGALNGRGINRGSMSHATIVECKGWQAKVRRKGYSRTFDTLGGGGFG